MKKPLSLAFQTKLKGNLHINSYDTTFPSLSPDQLTLFPYPFRSLGTEIRGCKYFQHRTEA